MRQILNLFGRSERCDEMKAKKFSDVLLEYAASTLTEAKKRRSEELYEVSALLVTCANKLR
jgi:hypothetical protein